jgi:hypothetical protein
VSEISQEELTDHVEEMLEQCEIIQSKLLSLIATPKPILQRALIQEGGHHALNLHNRFFELENELLRRRIGLK